MMAGGTWRSFRAAAWLGWQIESNWADPFLFAVYSVVKPLAAAGILVVMYGIVTGGRFESPAFAYMYLGNAFYMYVGAVMTGVAYAVIDDRERYRTLKYVYVAPIDIRLYLVGRAAARVLTGTVAVAITIAAGVLWLDVPVRLATIHWPLLAVSLTIGLVSLALLGLALGGVVMQVAHQSWSVGEAVAGTLFLFSGAVFPLEVLPAWLRPIGFALPVTYWLELMRRALVGPGGFQTLAGLSDLQLLAILTALTGVLALVTLASFRRCEHRARERGLIDRTTSY
jgi:ABC-2 type transport system permease protein